MQTAQERPETLRYSRQEGKTARLSSEHWHSAGSPVPRHAHALDLSVRTHAPEQRGAQGQGPPSYWAGGLGNFWPSQLPPLVGGELRLQ